MIRWKYAVPRLLLLLTILLAVYLGLNPLLKWAVESLGEQVFSLRVDVGSIDASPARTEIRIRDFAVANPKSPNTNLLDADRIILSLDTNALLRRKFVVRKGHIEGLRLRSQRETVAEPIDHWQWDVTGDRLKQEAEAWLKTLSESLGEKLEAEVNDLESVQLAKELLASWPEEYQQLEARVEALKVRAENLRTLFRTRPQNLAAGLQHYQKTLAEVQQLQQELKSLGVEIDSLPDRVRSDRETIVAATRRDVKRMEDRFQSIRLDRETITGYFLGPEMGRRVVKITDWVRQVRSHFPELDPEPERQRLLGTNILFAGRRPQPDFLVESLRLDGETTIDGKVYSFSAAAAGLTNQPKIYGRPAEIRARLVGDAQFEVHAVLDRSGECPVDQVVIDCPNLALPETSLGREDSLALTFRPGNTHLWASLRLSGDRIAGTMLIRQSGVELRPKVADALGGRRLADALATATESLNEIEVQVDLAGKLAGPEWVVRSNFGDRLAEGLNRAAAVELEYRKRQAAQFVQEQADRELSKFRNRLAMDEEILMSRLNLSRSDVEQLGKLIAQQIPSADQILTKALGDRLPPLRF
ncbi:MAG: TIGR03545 family protein [Thermoguttaceae bacterium]